MLKGLIQVLTGHDWSQRAPCQPAVHVQDPSAGLHFAPLAQWQVALHPGPQVPSAQGAEQSSPRQPAETQWTVSHIKPVTWLIKGSVTSLSAFLLPQCTRPCKLFTLFAEARPVDWWAVDKVVTGAFKGAVLAIGATFAWTLTVNPLY